MTFKFSKEHFTSQSGTLAIEFTSLRTKSTNLGVLDNDQFLCTLHYNATALHCLCSESRESTLTKLQQQHLPSYPIACTCNPGCDSSIDWWALATYTSTYAAIWQNLIIGRVLWISKVQSLKVPHSFVRVQLCYNTGYNVLNSSPIDELRCQCLQSWWSQAMLQHEEVSMATP